MRRSLLTWLLVTIVAVHLAVAGWYATVRPIDGDEGYYGLAARLVTEGRAPYTGFFYPQAPLLPYLYAPGAALAGAPQLPGLRMVSVLWSGLCLGLAAWWLRRVHGQRPAVAATILLMLALSPELLQWQTTVKTYAWNNLMALAALLALGTAEHRARWLLGGGVMLGLGIASRLLYAPLALAGALWLLAGGQAQGRRDAALWLGGVAIGLVPAWILLVQDPAAFWFNNVGYHQLRINLLADAPLLVRWQTRVAVLGASLTAGPVMSLMWALGLWGAWRSGRRDMARLSLLMAAVHTLASLVPEPTYRQYFTATLPVLLLPAAAAGLSALVAVRPRLVPAVTAGLIPALAVVWLGLLRPEIDRAVYWRLDHYHYVSRVLASLTAPGDIVFSFWSGYVGGSGRQALPGLENHFAVAVSERLDAVERRRLRIAGRHEMATAFREEIPAAVVLGVWMHDLTHVLDNAQTQALMDVFNRHYGFVVEVEGAKVCRRWRDLGGRPDP